MCVCVCVTERTAVRSAAQCCLRLSAHRCACDVLLWTKLATFGALLCAGCKVCPSLSCFFNGISYCLSTVTTCHHVSPRAVSVTPFAACPSSLPLAVPHSCVSLYIQHRCFPDCYYYGHAVPQWPLLCYHILLMHTVS